MKFIIIAILFVTFVALGAPTWLGIIGGIIGLLLVADHFWAASLRQQVAEAAATDRAELEAGKFFGSR